MTDQVLVTILDGRMFYFISATTSRQVSEVLAKEREKKERNEGMKAFPTKFQQNFPLLTDKCWTCDIHM